MPADTGKAGKLAMWAGTLKMTVCIVARRERHAIEVLPRRWVVELTFARISKHRRTVRDYAHLPASHEALVRWAMTALVTRRLAQTPNYQTLTKAVGGVRRAAGIPCPGIRPCGRASCAAAGPVPSARTAVRGSAATGARRAQRAFKTVEKVLTK